MTPRASAGAAPEKQALIGPNAVTQLRSALMDEIGADAARTIFVRADAVDAFDRPPTVMIDERLARRVFDALFQSLPADKASHLAKIAGTRTADYIIAHRIPKAAARFLSWAPPALAGPMLIRAIAKHAWTFAGSGRFKTLPSRRSAPRQVAIDDNPLTMPNAVWHQAVFERLFQVLVCQGATATTRQSPNRSAGPSADRASDRITLHYGRRAAPGPCPRLSGEPGPALCLHCVAKPRAA